MFEPGKPIVTLTDAAATQVRALMDAGIEIGKEISVIVWGNVEDTLIGINVTTIDQPDLRRAGAKMVEMLQSLLAGTPPERLQ